MASNNDSMWRCFSGFVQWDPKDGNVNGKDVRWVTIKALGLAGTEIRLTLWPEFSKVDVNKGDYVAVEGTYEQRDSGGNTYHNLSVKRICVSPTTGAEAPKASASKSKKVAENLDDIL